MLDPKLFKDQPQETRDLLLRRGAEYGEQFDNARILAEDHRRLLQEYERLAEMHNTFSGDLYAASVLSAQKKAAKKEADRVRDAARAATARLPNIPAQDVHDGKAPVLIKEWGKKQEFSFAPKTHYTLGERLGVMDSLRASRLSGSRFSVLSGAGAFMERALVSFMLNEHLLEGYKELSVPYLVKKEAMFGAGTFPKFEEEVFATNDELYLIPTAEVPITSFHAGDSLFVDSLPRKYASYTPCFRREAGSAGADTRGLIRQHQFGKVELVRLELPEESEAAHEKLTRNAEKLLEKLGLHYRRVLLGAEDMGFSARKTYDLEVWMPGMNAYREISSCSNFGDFQARRAGLKFRDKSGKESFLHTLNGSALAIGRTIAAIFEQHQTEEGYINVPLCLQRYMPYNVIYNEDHL